MLCVKSGKRFDALCRPVSFSLGLRVGRTAPLCSQVCNCLYEVSRNTYARHNEHCIFTRKSIRDVWFIVSTTRSKAPFNPRKSQAIVHERRRSQPAPLAHTQFTSCLLERLIEYKTNVPRVLDWFVCSTGARSSFVHFLLRRWWL